MLSPAWLHVRLKGAVHSCPVRQAAPPDPAALHLLRLPGRTHAI